MKLLLVLTWEWVGQVSSIITIFFTFHKLTNITLAGGGFSNVTPRPSYQDLAVNQYLKNSDTVPPTDYFNQTGRAYADAVTVGHNLEVVLNSQLVAIGTYLMKIV